MQLPIAIYCLPQVAEFQEALQKSQLPAHRARPSEAMKGSTNGRKPRKAVSQRSQSVGSRERSSDKANLQSTAKPALPAHPETGDLGDVSWLKDGSQPRAPQKFIKLEVGYSMVSNFDVKYHQVAGSWRLLGSLSLFSGPFPRTSSCKKNMGCFSLLQA